MRVTDCQGETHFAATIGAATVPWLTVAIITLLLPVEVTVTVLDQTFGTRRRCASAIWRRAVERSGEVKAAIDAALRDGGPSESYAGPNQRGSSSA